MSSLRYLSEIEKKCFLENAKTISEDCYNLIVCWVNCHVLWVLVTNIWISGSIWTCLETAKKWKRKVWERRVVYCELKQVRILHGLRSKHEPDHSQVKKDLRASSDFSEDSEEEWSRPDHWRVCYKNVQAARLLWINTPPPKY